MRHVGSIPPHLRPISAAASVYSKASASAGQAVAQPVLILLAAGKSSAAIVGGLPLVGRDNQDALTYNYLSLGAIAWAPLLLVASSRPQLQRSRHHGNYWKPGTWLHSSSKPKAACQLESYSNSLGRRLG